jgi:hypothetical protein
VILLVIERICWRRCLSSSRRHLQPEADGRPAINFGNIGAAIRASTADQIECVLHLRRKRPATKDFPFCLAKSMLIEACRFLPNNKYHARSPLPFSFAGMVSFIERLEQVELLERVEHAFACNILNRPKRLNVWNGWNGFSVCLRGSVSIRKSCS